MIFANWDSIFFRSPNRKDIRPSGMHQNITIVLFLSIMYTSCLIVYLALNVPLLSILATVAERPTVTAPLAISPMGVL